MSRAEVAEVCEEKDPAVICSFLLFFPSEGRGEKHKPSQNKQKRGGAAVPSAQSAVTDEDGNGNVF